MKNLFFLAVVLTSFSLFAQNNGSINGNVADLEANGEPLLFADVTLKGTDLKTRTNFNGNFEIANVTEGKYTLEVGFLGYETLNIPVEVHENKVSQIQTGLSAKSIVLDPLALSTLEIEAGDVLVNLERNMED